MRKNTPKQYIQETGCLSLETLIKEFPNLSVGHLRRSILAAGGILPRAKYTYSEASKTKMKIDNKYARSCRKDIPTHEEIFPSDPDYLAYLCGFIATDGSLHSKNIGNITIQLSIKDEIFLEALTRPLTRLKTTSYYSSGRVNAVKKSLQLPQLYQYCLDMGITPNKTYTLSVSSWDKWDLKTKLYFLRGVIDGDGCISLKDYPTITISTASRFFAGQILSLIHASISITNKPNCQPLYNLCLHASKASLLARVLPNPPYALQRKSSNLEATKNWQYISSRCNLSLQDTQEILNYLKETAPISVKEFLDKDH